MNSLVHVRMQEESFLKSASLVQSQVVGQGLDASISSSNSGKYNAKN